MCSCVGGQPQNARGRAQAIPPLPSLCHPPPPCFTYPAIAALAAPRGIPGEGRANARNAGWALALQAADGPAPSSSPHQHWLIASASFGSTVHQQKLKAWLKRAKKGKLFSRGSLRLASSEDGTLKGSLSPAPKKKALDVKQKLEEF